MSWLQECVDGTDTYPHLNLCRADVSNAAFHRRALIWKALIAIATAQVLSSSPFYKWGGGVRPQQGEVLSQGHTAVGREWNRKTDLLRKLDWRPCFCIAGDQTEGAVEAWQPRTKWLFMAPIPFKGRLFN